MTTAETVSATRARTRAAVDVVTPATVFTSMSLIGLALSMRVLNTWDESWFVQVVLRMRHGDALYRDISYGAGPLPAYLTEGLTYVVGIDVLAEKLVVVFAFAASATLLWVVAARLGLGTRGRLLLLVALVYLGPPGQEPPYGPLATTFTVAALAAALAYRTSETTRQRVFASLAGGAACGLAAVCKQNVGLYALVAFVVVIIVHRHVRDALLAVGAAATCTVAVLLPVVFSGGFARYLDYGFTGKGQYVDHRLGISAGLDGVLQSIRDVHSVSSAEIAYWGGRVFFPFVAAAALAALVLSRRRRRAPVLPLALFGAVALATLFPRFDPGHVAYAAPPLALLVAYLFDSWSARVPRAAWIAASVWMSVGVAIAVTLPFRLARSDAANMSDLPHLHGAFVQADDLVTWHRSAARLRAAAHGRRDGLLLLTPDAGFRYLSSGLSDPTAFDFPFVTTFGMDGQQRVIQAISAGRIKRVCVARDWFGFEPTQLVDYVRRTMRPGAELGICRLYTS